MSQLTQRVVLISRMKDIQRVFMYHGAEHKCINCVEHGLELNVENVMKSSREHKRCGTSFLLFVMIVSIIFLFVYPGVFTGTAGSDPSASDAGYRRSIL